MATPSRRPRRTSRHIRIVPLSAHDAFHLFIEGLPKWWPHRTPFDQGPLKVEGKKGGRIFATLPDGTASAWARITAWDPGARLGLLWHPGMSEADGDSVEVRFRQLDTGTEVTVTHTISHRGQFPHLSVTHATGEAIPPTPRPKPRRQTAPCAPCPAPKRAA